MADSVHCPLDSRVLPVRLSTFHSHILTLHSTLSCQRSVLRFSSSRQTEWQAGCCSSTYFQDVMNPRGQETVPGLRVPCCNPCVRCTCVSTVHVNSLLHIKHSE